MCVTPGYILFSEQGKWGLMVSDEHHGLLGGSSEFMRIFSEHTPDIDRQVYDFLEVMHDVRTDGSRKKLNWLLQILSHVYGRENALDMIEKVEQSSLI